MINQRGERGAVLVFSLLIIVSLIALSGSVALRSASDMDAARRDARMAKAYSLGEAGANAGLDGIYNLVNNYALNTVGAALPSTVAARAQQYAVEGKAIRFLCWALKDEEGTPLYTCPADLDPDPESLTYVQAPTAVGLGAQSGGTYSYTVVFREKNAPLPVGSDIWDFNYIYEISAVGTHVLSQEEVRLTGDFTVRVQRDNFAKYALFTNAQTTPSGSNVWFTANTNFAGPIHTNQRFNIYGNPSGVFDGPATQAQTTARYYNYGNTVLLDADHNGTADVPVFNAGFNRGVESVTLSSAVLQQDMIDQASDETVYGSDGVYLPNDGAVLTGGIFVKGDADVTLEVDGDNACYRISQGGAVHRVTVDRAGNRTVYDDGSDVVIYSGAPDGVDGVGTILYVDGNITSFQGTVQRDTKLTVASTDDVVIQDNIQYANYTAASGAPGDEGYSPPAAAGAANLLGVVSWGGDVVIGALAPDDVQVHGTILAQSGVFRVQGYDDSGVGPRGTATLLGGVITNNYGAFGRFNSSTGQNISGYGRNFVYDQRMMTGSAPPYFPSLDTFVAFTNDITDKMVWQ
jgi:hypothetical protein